MKQLDIAAGLVKSTIVSALKPKPRSRATRPRRRWLARLLGDEAAGPRVLAEPDLRELERQAARDREAEFDRSVGKGKRRSWLERW